MVDDGGYKITIENADIIPGFRNFAGRENQYNKAGVRNFCINIEPDLADRLIKDEWSSIKYHKDPDTKEIDPEAPYMRVAVRYDVFPPNIVVVTSNAKTKLTEDMVEMLDWADIKTADLIVKGSYWKMADGKMGYKPYLRTMYVIIEEDELVRKYEYDEE